jgi:hypothetical protein
MSHLSPERLAALTDETPNPIEAAHLATCRDCTAEIAAQRRLARMAIEAQAVTVAPLSNFDALRPRLQAEGLVVVPDRMAAVRLWAVRIAASAALVIGGAVGGRLSAGAPLPFTASAIGAGGTTGGSPSLAAAPANFQTTDEAMKALEVSQQTYQTAAAFLAAQDTSARFIGLNENSYRTRLSALDQMAAVTRAALYQAPQDPVLNQAYLGVQGAREATLRQINQTLPATKRLGAY